MRDIEDLLQAFENIKVIDSGYQQQKYIALDLADTDSEFYSCKNSASFDAAIQKHLLKNDAQVAFGGYGETRNLYSRSNLFKNDLTEERNIHIGLDLWIKAGTPVLAPIDGKIHSFKNNRGLGNYGPTVILEHQIDNRVFYTLYGHLTVKSLEKITINQRVKQGETIAFLGDSSVNGDYAPHLHFQIIQNLDGHFGDYPGVCSSSTIGYFLKNCPDPNLLLKINNTIT